MDGQTSNKVAKFDYREFDRLFTEEFIGGVNDEGMTEDILRELATLEDIEEATTEHVLTWACRVEVQRTQGIALNTIMETKEYGKILKNMNARQCTVTNASTVRQDTHPSSALHMGRNVENAAKKPFQGSLQILMVTTGELEGQEDS